MWIDVVAFQPRKRQNFSPRYYMDAVWAATQADKGIDHFPFGGWVEECQFIAAANRSGSDDQHTGGIQDNIRVTRMIRICQCPNLNMTIFAYLDRMLGRADMGCSAGQFANYFRPCKASFGEKAFVAVIGMDNKCFGAGVVLIILHKIL